jgi:hypothetical protein
LNLPATNEYLNQHFEDLSKDLSHMKIRPITLIHYHFFYQCAYKFSKKNLKLNELIDDFINYRKRREKNKNMFNYDEQFKMNTYACFNSVISRQLRIMEDNIPNSFLKKTLEHFNLSYIYE